MTKSEKRNRDAALIRARAIKRERWLIKTGRRLAR